MKIERISCFEVIVSAHEGAVDSKDMQKPLHKLPVGAKPGWSVQFDQIAKLILKMELSNGVIGWGELYRGHDWNMVENIAKVLIGMDLRGISLQNLPFTFCREYDGFECAIWDAYAKSHQMRLVDLLGGPVQDRIKIGAWSSHRHIEEIGELAKKYHGQGYDCLKFKCDLEDDVVGWCCEIKSAAPGMSVILDPNERWGTSGETRKRIDGLKEIGNVLCLEDPIPRWQMNEYSKLRSYGSIPIVLHVSLPYILHGQKITDAVCALQREAVDGFNFNCGLADFQRLDHIATVAGLPCWHGSEIDLGILEAMYVHSAAASKSCVWPSDIFGQLIRSHDLLQKPLEIHAPYIELPIGYGLGVVPDEDAIKEFQISFKSYTI